METKNTYCDIEYRNGEFSVYELNDVGLANADLIRNRFDALLNQLSNICMPGREFSIVKTKLEEASFFAKKAMAINLVYQKTE